MSFAVPLGCADVLDPCDDEPFEVFSLPIIERPRILVVDDENGPRQSLRMVLKEQYEVHLAADVDQAIEVMASTNIDLIISDIRMPRKSGIDLLSLVHRNQTDIGVILLTGYGELRTAMQAMEHGAFAYLEKPFDHKLIVEKVQDCLERQHGERERRAMEHMALEANRFSTLGHLMSGAMHDLGTPLSVLGANIDILHRMTDTANSKHRLDTMRDQIAHCTDLVRSAMNFLRQAPEHETNFNINSAVELCLDVARPVLRKHSIIVRKQLSTQLPSCAGDLVLVRQALLNLIYNATQALEEVDRPRCITIETRLTPEGVLLAVEDNGPGVPHADRERVFGSLYTTKGNNGTGLGLPVVRNVMRRHGGTARLSPTLGPGARFELVFPLQEPS